MLPPRTRLDPEGYYARLGLEPSASRADVVTAFRSRVRLLHPDIPRTGNVAAFLALKQAYDVLSDQERRTTYDQSAGEPVWNGSEPNVIVPRRKVSPATIAPVRQRRLYPLSALLWVSMGGFLCLSVYEAVAHLLTPSMIVPDGIRPNAAIVAPLSPNAHRAVLYGPEPVRLPGLSNFFVSPSGGPVVLWGINRERNAMVPLRQLPPFSTVQAVRLIRQNGLLEVLVNEHGNGFITAARLTPGNAEAARKAYCGYNAGPAPIDGEMLERHGDGHGTLAVENRAVQPAVVKLRDETGAVVIAVFLDPGGHVLLTGLPEGTYQTDFAIGELWSRACSSFAAGMRAQRMDASMQLIGDAKLVVAPDVSLPAAKDIPDQAFERK